MGRTLFAAEPCSDSSLLSARNAVGVVSTALSICYLAIGDRASFISVADADAIRDR